MEMIRFMMVEELALLVKDNLMCKHLVLSTEEALVNFLQDDTSPDSILELEPMSAYNRLLLHRLADIFGLAHESVGEGDDRHLVLERCPESSIPPILVSDILWQYDGVQPSSSSAHILMRNDLSDPKQSGSDSTPSMSMEEREAAYMAARRRIFTMHENDEKEPAESKPRSVPVVAQRMIAHALGQRIYAPKPSSLGHEDGPVEELSSAVAKVLIQTPKESTRTSGHSAAKKKVTKKPTNDAIANRTSSGRRCSFDAKAEVNIDTRQEDKCSVVDCRELSRRKAGKVADSVSLEREQFGAARRMFAHALGLPSGSGLKCNQKSKG